jgi:hypothetical protein
VTVPVAPTPEGAEEDFGSAFAQFSTDESTPAPAEAADTAPSEPTTPPVEDTPVEEAPIEEAPIEEAPIEEPPAAPSESDDDLMARLASLVRRAEPEPTRAPVPEDAQPVVAEEPIYSDEEQQALAKYAEDWPEIAQGEALRRRSEYKQLVDYVFTEIARNLGPVLQTTQTMAQMQHLSQLQTAVPDYGEVRDRVIDWALQQPPYLKNAYERVIREGTADEVVDLINRYRQETGTARTSAPAAPRATELSSQAKKAAAALAPVSSKRSTNTGSIDPMDFDGAFATFSGKL